jgi:hypothetical protein
MRKTSRCGTSEEKKGGIIMLTLDKVFDAQTVLKNIIREKIS